MVVERAMVASVEKREKGYHEKEYRRGNGEMRGRRVYILGTSGKLLVTRIVGCDALSIAGFLAPEVVW